MVADPFNSWYAAQMSVDTENYYKPDDWTFFTVCYDAGSTEEVNAKVLERDKVDEWVDQQSQVRQFYMHGIAIPTERYLDPLTGPGHRHSVSEDD